jgi:predicted SAM-dependent methyltransferase
MTEIKLHIGCANTKIAGYINIDIRSTSATDIVTPAWNLHMYDDGVVSSIYCRHVFEHLDPNEAVMTLKEWHRVLVPGGAVNLIVPDLLFHCRQLLERAHIPKELNHAMAGFYGWRDERKGGNAHDAHKWGYTEQTLTSLVAEFGFSHISRRLKGKDSESHHLNLDMFK